MTRHRRWSTQQTLVAVVILLSFVFAMGCTSPPPEAPAEPAVFGYEPAAGEMLVWFFALEAEDRSGDAILIQFPSGETMLVDAGIEAAGDQLERHLRRIGVSHITYAVGTHPHHDHIGGYVPLLTWATVDNYITVNVPHETETYRRVNNGMSAHEIPVMLVEAGQEFTLPGGIEVQVLNPPQGTSGDDVPPGTDASGINNLSLVFRMDYGECSFLFAADVYREREAALVREYADQLDTDVIKVPHHGESTSSSTAFVDAVSPEYAVITINILQSLPIYRRYVGTGARTFLTGIDGTVLLVCDGSNIIAHPERFRASDSLF